MSEGMVTIITTIITVGGTVIVALLGWLTKKGIDFVDAKTKVMDEKHNLEQKAAIKQRIVDAVVLAAGATMETYVKKIKAAKESDGKLTEEEGKEAMKQTISHAMGLLKQEGIEIGEQVLPVIVEAIVGKLKKVKK